MLSFKGAMPDEVSVESDGQSMRVKLVHGFGTKESTFVYDLWGEIIPEESKARIGERKVTKVNHLFFMLFKSKV